MSVNHAGIEHNLPVYGVGSATAAIGRKKNWRKRFYLNL
jgi:hypothetical protein